MEEDHHHHSHHHYGGGGGGGINSQNPSGTPMADLRQFFSPIPIPSHFPPPLFATTSSSAFAAPLPHHYDAAMMLVMADHGGGGGPPHDFRSENPTAAPMMPPASSGAGFDMEAGGGFGLGVDGGATARWPRQETLTLLEIRSRLDHKFKEANHKGPLWDEVSRIMSEEHGYQRSGKKCREKFENLYKYYKKTKEGKAGRQDGKHYRFFRQLEALYGDQSSSNHHHHSSIPISDHTHLNMISNNTPTPIQIHSSINAVARNGQEGFQSMSLSNTSSDYETSSSDGNEGERVGSMEMNGESSSGRKRRGVRRSWKGKIKEFIDSQMRKIMDKQEAWLERMMRTLECKEKERVLREEEWRKQEGLRVEREHRFWAKERAWIEARDKALMDALQRITGKEMVVVVDNEKLRKSHDDDEDEDRWDESEMMKLIEMRASMQGRFDECGGPDEGDLWEEVSARMACLGHDRSAKMCKRRWGFFNKELSKKRKENCINSKSQHYLQEQEHGHLQMANNNLYTYGDQVNGQGGMMGLGPPQIGLGGGNPMNDSCLRILLGDQGESHAWESYGVKLNKGDQTH